MKVDIKTTRPYCNTIDFLPPPKPQTTSTDAQIFLNSHEYLNEETKSVNSEYELQNNDNSSMNMWNNQFASGVSGGVAADGTPTEKFKDLKTPANLDLLKLSQSEAPSV